MGYCSVSFHLLLIQHFPNPISFGPPWFWLWRTSGYIHNSAFLLSCTYNATQGYKKRKKILCLHHSCILSWPFLASKCLKHKLVVHLNCNTAEKIFLEERISLWKLHLFLKILKQFLDSCSALSTIREENFTVLNCPWKTH